MILWGNGSGLRAAGHTVATVETQAVVGTQVRRYVGTQLSFPIRSGTPVHRVALPTAPPHLRLSANIFTNTLEAYLPGYSKSSWQERLLELRKTHFHDCLNKQVLFTRDWPDDHLTLNQGFRARPLTGFRGPFYGEGLGFIENSCWGYWLLAPGQKEGGTQGSQLPVG